MAVVKRTDGRGRRTEDKGNSTKEEVAPASKVCIFIVAFTDARWQLCPAV